MKTLAELATYLNLVHITDEVGAISLTDLWVDSRSVTEKSVFIALQGTQSHGAEYAEQAEKLGASCILLEKIPGLVIYEPQSKHCKVWVIENLAQKLAELAKWFYQNPSASLKLIGITGTNGKTSTSHYIAQLLDAQQHRVALMGTLGNGFLNQLTPSPNTTMDVVSVNRELRRLKTEGAEYVVMEVSSHAITLGRIKGLKFEVLALTQVTRDHLDFHQTEKAYREAKKTLFLDYDANVYVLNLDDEVGVELSSLLTQKHKTLIHFSETKPAVEVCLETFKLSPKGMSGKLQIGDQMIRFKLPLLGQFNVENALCTASVVKACGFSAEQIEQTLSVMTSVAGRMELIHHKNCPSVVIDYAHTPDALEAVLLAAKAHQTHKKSRLWLVFGCGGNRDSGKRPLMGLVAERYADEVVLTDDNPRDESPELIIAEIQSGLSHPTKVIHNRAEAIQFAVASASPKDTVVIAGKGHEDYQEIKGKRYPLQDKALALSALRCDLERGQH